MKRLFLFLLFFCLSSPLTHADAASFLEGDQVCATCRSDINDYGKCNCENQIHDVRMQRSTISVVSNHTRQPTTSPIYKKTKLGDYAWYYENTTYPHDAWIGEVRYNILRPVFTLGYKTPYHMHWRRVK